MTVGLTVNAETGDSSSGVEDVEPSGSYSVELRVSN